MGSRLLARGNVLEKLDICDAIEDKLPCLVEADIIGSGNANL